MPYHIIKKQHPQYKQYKEEFGSELGDPNSIKYYEILSDSNKKAEEKKDEKKKQD